MGVDLNWMDGSVVEHIKYEKQTHQWWFYMGDQNYLSLECHWQIISEGRVALASGDHGQNYGLPAPIDAVAKATTLLAGRKVENVSIHPQSSDLTIAFAGEVIMRTFNDSSGFEAWAISGGGFQYIAQGGGNVVKMKLE